MNLDREKEGNKNQKIIIIWNSNISHINGLINVTET